MSLVPEGARCCVALGISLIGQAEQALQYASALSAWAQQAEIVLQFFVDVQVIDAAPRQVQQLAWQGHGVDLCVPATGGLADADPAQTCGLLTRTNALLQDLGGQPLGVRPATMNRIGIQKYPEMQQAILDAGLGFVSSDYSTKPPANPGDPGFADKNAAMLMKHSQPRRYSGGLLEIPAAGYSDADLLDVQGRPLTQWIDHVKDCVDFAHDMGGLIYAPDLHAEVLARHDPQLATVEELTAHARGKRAGLVEFCTLRDVLVRAQG